MRGEGRAYQHAEVTLSQVNHGRVEVGALIEGGQDTRARQGRRDLEICHQHDGFNHFDGTCRCERLPRRTNPNASWTLSGASYCGWAVKTSRTADGLGVHR